jgi:hypothetical protein
MNMTKKLIILAIGAGFALPLSAQQLSCGKSYAFRVDANGTVGSTVCVSKATSFIDVAKDFNISNSAYTLTSAAQIMGRFNDVNIDFSYAVASNTFNYNFIEIGVSGSFTGINRQDSQDQFVDFVKKSDIIGKLMKYQALHSATSPIAGVGGIIPMAGALDFSSSFDTLSKITSGPPQISAVSHVPGSVQATASSQVPGSAPISSQAQGGTKAPGGLPAQTGLQSESGSNNLIGIALSYSSYNVTGSSDKVSSTSLPLSYTIRNDIDPRRQLVLSMPLTQVSIGDASTYHGGLGIAYRLPLSDQWTLTPGGKYSIVASEDRATVATVMSANMMSTYVIPFDGLDMAIGNMLGYYKTGKFSHGDYSFSPDVTLTMARNGIMLSMPTSIFGDKMAAEYSFIDTRYLGDKPFVSSTQEIGVTIGTNRNATNARTYIRAGASYLKGKSVSGFTVNLGYWF